MKAGMAGMGAVAAVVAVLRPSCMAAAAYPGCSRSPGEAGRNIPFR